jgi:ubiquinone/menaquinone biosynthesis C-methylase UbiE
MEKVDKQPCYVGEDHNFDLAASHYDARPDYPEVFYQAVEYRIRHLTPKRFVDLGCGDGRVAVRLARWQAEVLGLDCSRPMLMVAAQNIRSQQNLSIPLIQGQATSLPFPSAAFDGVLTGQALHWMRKELVVREVVRILKPGGLWIVFWIQPMSPWSELVRMTDDVIMDFVSGYDVWSAQDLTVKSRIPLQPGLRVHTWTTRFTQTYDMGVYVNMVANKSFIVNSLQPEAHALFKLKLLQTLVQHGFSSRIDLLNKLTVHFAERI